MISFFCSHLHFSLSLLPSLLLFSFLLLFNSNLRLLKKKKSGPGWGGNTLNLIIWSLLQHSVPEPTEKYYWVYSNYSFQFYLLLELYWSSFPNCTVLDLIMKASQSLLASSLSSDTFLEAVKNNQLHILTLSSLLNLSCCHMVLLLRYLGPPFYEH